jgi:hypothetical protein
MLVHSFSSTHRWFEEFAAFSALGIPLHEPNRCSSAKECDGVSLRLAWVSDALRRFERLPSILHRLRLREPNLLKP